MKFRMRHCGVWLAAGAVIALAGCVATPGPSGRSSSATGQHSTQPESATAHVRRMANNKWQVSFGHTSRVAEIRSAKLRAAQVVHTARIGEATTAMLRVNWDGCESGYIFVAVTENRRQEADTVRFDHPCSDVEPIIQTGHTEQYIDFIVGNRVKRYIYRSGDALQKDRDVVLRPGQSLPPPAGANGQAAAPMLRYRPGIPFRPTAEELQERPSATLNAVPSAAAAKGDKSKPGRSSQPESRKADLPGRMSFPAEPADKRPIDVDLNL